MSLRASGSDSASFRRLDQRIQRWIWQSGWTELKDAQERAIPLILEGKSDVIIAAATASGKTEAAFFPILTTMLAATEPSTVLYVSPLKALINDQWSRLDRLCESLEIPVFPWHGDVSATLKKKFRKEPRGCLLITPESLEGLLMREGHALAGILGELSHIVIDELHAFIDSERGKQVQSLMHRIDVALDRKVPRIGLSATLGEMRLAADFLRPGCGEGVVIIDSDAEGQELKVAVKGFYDHTSQVADLEPASDAKRAIRDAASKELTAGVLAVGEQLFATLRGANHLVFPNSRARVELYADLLRRACERLQLPNEFWPHHGSLSKEVREETERALKVGDRPATAIATTTLELGIDIGAVRSIAQIGPAPSVASLRQRVGRSGRRRGEAAILRCYCIEQVVDVDAPLSDQLREGLVQTVAQLRLLIRNWFEPPRRSSMHLSTLVQQLLSLIAQYGGVSATRAWSLLCESGLFPGCDKSDFVQLLRTLGEKEILMQDATGLLLHGVTGEKIVNHYSFLASFMSAEEFRVVCKGRPLGTLPLDRPITHDSFLIFAGRRWRVVGCFPEDKLLDVVPAAGGKVPTFDGMGGKVHDRVREEMRTLLCDGSIQEFLDPTARVQLAEARAAYVRLDLNREPVLQSGRNVNVFSWQGDWVNDTLALMLKSRGLYAANEGLTIGVRDAEKNVVMDALRDIAGSPAPDAQVLASFVQNKQRAKWDVLLPEALLCRNFASSELDVAGAMGAAAAITGASAARRDLDIDGALRSD